jgi:hypothetical protein
MPSNKPTSRGSLSLLLATALVLIFAIAGAGTAYASCSQPFNCFAGDDGDQASGPNGLTDWQDIAASVIPTEDPAKGMDNKFAGGDKETDPGSWDFITGNNTPKTDILEGWSKFDGRFLYVAFSRVKQTGDTFLSFELNQLGAGPRTSNGIAVPHRSTGDILFTYDISTTNKLSFGMCTWQGDENSGDWLRLDGTAVGGSIKECTKLDKQTTPAAEGNVNWNAPIDPNYLTDFKPIGTGQFGEAVVDLGALGGRFLSDACGPNGWFWMHSRASRAVLSQPKDLLAGNPIANPTCGLTIDKKVSPTGAPGTFVDAPQANPVAASVGDTVAYQITLTNTGTADLVVNLTDPRCDAGTITGGGDGVNDPLGAGQSITYTCMHTITAADPDPFQNTACTTGTAMLGGASTTLGVAPDTICDDAWVDVVPPGPGGQVVSPTTQAPSQAVLGTRLTGGSGARIRPGSARLLGATGCQARAFRARITGTRIAKVIFTLDGHRVATLTRKNYRGTYAVRIDPSRLRLGVHRLVAKVTFERGSATKAKTIRLSFQRCSRALRAPRFTG